MCFALGERRWITGFAVHGDWGYTEFGTNVGFDMDSFCRAMLDQALSFQ